ncbi:MAG: transglycosylase SLT domain-containing protein [Nitrospirae bacterium]|nr:transglycosylase SLT domain-containing protein [Nitrospirota bacterium]
MPENRPQQVAPQQGALTRSQPQPANSGEPAKSYSSGDSADIPGSMLQDVNLTGSFLNFKDYESIVHTLSAQHSLDPSLVKAVIKAESNWNQSALSQKGAMGLMQLMPGTASLLSVNDPYNPVENIDGGIRYLKFLLKKFNGDTTLAIAAYNAGPGAVERYGTIPPYAETQQYVTRVLSIYNGNSYYPSASSNGHSVKTKSYATYPAYRHIYKVKMHDGSILYTNTSPEAFLRTTERF